MASRRRAVVWREFGKLVFQPAAKAWNVIGAGIAGIIAIALWWRHHWLVGGVLLLAALALLLVTAGYHLQARLDDLKIHRGFVEALGYELKMGQLCFFDIEQAGRKFDEGFKRLQTEAREKDLDKAAVHARLEELSGKLESVTKWEQSVGDFLTKNLDYSYRARFENDAGLSHSSPPSDLSKFYVDRWVHLDRRLQRLHQIIEEVSSRVTA